MSLVFALVNGLDFSSYYIFYGGLFFALIWVSGLRWLYERGDRRWRCARSAAAAARSWSGPASRSTRSRTRCSADAPPTRYETVGYISLTPQARQRAAQPRRARRAAASCSTSTACRR